MYDLREYRPGPVLQKIYANLAAAVRNGDRAAHVVRRSVVVGVIRVQVSIVIEQCKPVPVVKVHHRSQAANSPHLFIELSPLVWA